VSYSTTKPGVLLVEPRRKVDVRSVLMLIAFLAVSAAVAVFGSLTTIASVDGWYEGAAKVWWTPPNWLFGPVWTALYVAMAVAAWLVWRRRHFFYVGPALALYTGQLFLNAVWSPVFFAGYEVIGDAALWIGVVVIVVLDICVTATIIAFWFARKAAAIILIPYLAWILYATTLNIGLAVLNS